MIFDSLTQAKRRDEMHKRTRELHMEYPQGWSLTNSEPEGIWRVVQVKIDELSPYYRKDGIACVVVSSLDVPLTFENDRRFYLTNRTPIPYSREICEGRVNEWMGYCRRVASYMAIRMVVVDGNEQFPAPDGPQCFLRVRVGESYVIDIATGTKDLGVALFDALWV
jgi:hypothetical protein